MTANVALGNSRLTVALDIRYPQAYLALHPVIEMARSLGLVVDWLPLSAATLKSPSAPSLGDDRSLLHRRRRAQSIATEIEVYADAQGLILRDYYREADAGAVNLGWLYMREHHSRQVTEYLSEAFRAYWACELDAGSESQVATLIDALGFDAATFRSWAASLGEALLAAVVDDLHARGVFAVPSYVVDDEIFLGRQHLPMIRWILEGREGPVPI